MFFKDSVKDSVSSVKVVNHFDEEEPTVKKLKKYDENNSPEVTFSGQNPAASNLLPQPPSVDQCSRNNRPRPLLICSSELLAACGRLLIHPQREYMVFSLLTAYKLHELCTVLVPCAASEAELLGFHCREYIEFIARQRTKAEWSLEELTELESFGLVHDCPWFPGLLDYVKRVAGASLTAAKCLTASAHEQIEEADHGDRGPPVAICWTGGRHHAKEDEASGYCYVNDICLCLLHMMDHYDRILYVDMDVHHPDAVEAAFQSCREVLTLSFHQYESGFFPGTGSVDCVGVGAGKYFSVNVPLLAGCCDSTFLKVALPVLQGVHSKYEPQAVVLQAGADALAGDPLGGFNLTASAYVEVVQLILGWQCPLLVLGGGGYHEANTARCWTLLTATLCNVALPKAIPEHNFFESYGPNFQLDVSAVPIVDNNSSEYIETILTILTKNIQRILS